MWSIWFGVWAAFNVLPFYLSVFGLGMLLAIGSVWASRLPAPSRWLEAVGRVPLLWWALALACCIVTVEVVGVPALGVPTRGQTFARVCLHSLLGLFLVIPAVFGRQDQGIVRRFLRWRPVVFLGVVSYGIYLWHPAAGSIIRDELMGVDQTKVSFLQLALPLLALTLAFASLSWFLVERPLIAFSRRPLWRRRGSDRNATAGPRPI